MNIPKLKCFLLFIGVIAPAASLADDADKATPSIDLLEFLGEWTTEDQEWIDPMLMKEVKSSNAATKKERIEENNHE